MTGCSFDPFNQSMKEKDGYLALAVIGVVCSLFVCCIGDERTNMWFYFVPNQRSGSRSKNSALLFWSTIVPIVLTVITGSTYA